MVQGFIGGIIVHQYSVYSVSLQLGLPCLSPEDVSYGSL